MPRTLKQIRWTIEHAAVEFNIDRKTLSGRIKHRGILSAEDGKFSTKDICVAVFTDGKAARDRLATAQEENFVLRNKKLAGVLVDPTQCQQLWDAAMIALRQKISDAPIPDATKREILKDLQTIPLNDYMANHTSDPDENASSESGPA